MYQRFKFQPSRRFDNSLLSLDNKKMKILRDSLLHGHICHQLQDLDM